MSQLSDSVHWTPFGQARSPWQIILQGSPFGHDAPLVQGCSSEHVTTHTPAWHVPTPAQPCSHFSGSGCGVTLPPSSLPPVASTASLLPAVPASPTRAGPVPPALAGVGTAMGTTAGVSGWVGFAPADPATAPRPWPPVPPVSRMPASVKTAPAEPHAAIDNAPAKQIKRFENIATATARAMPRSGNVRYEMFLAHTTLPPSRT